LVSHIVYLLSFSLYIYTHKMKEAIVSKGPKVEILDSPIPEPGPEQVVIKVVVSGSNPKDW
jgi:D-arabinose 1-dehydrogenase-like Zn-dependent alcohol dehydrogenase